LRDFRRKVPTAGNGLGVVEPRRREKSLHADTADRRPTVGAHYWTKWNVR
jgi:hypothetical protein